MTKTGHHTTTSTAVITLPAAAPTDTHSLAAPMVNDADHAVLDAAWHKAFDALTAAGLSADADDPIAARYRAASNEVNHANRSRDFAISTGQPTNGSRHTTTSPVVLTLPAPAPMGTYATAVWLAALTDDNTGFVDITVDIAGIALAQMTAAEYVTSQLFDGNQDAVSDLSCSTVTGLASGLVRLNISFDATNFVAENLCQTEECEGDPNLGDSYAGYCPECADFKYAEEQANAERDERDANVA